MQALVPGLTADLEDLWNSMRLFERKLVVVKGMMADAAAEARRCERDMEMCQDEIHADDRLQVRSRRPYLLVDEGFKIEKKETASHVHVLCVSTQCA